MKCATKDECATREVRADRIADLPLVIGTARLVEMDHQSTCRRRGKLLDASDDVLFSVAVQVLLTERRRVERLEQLAHLAQMHVDARECRARVHRGCVQWVPRPSAGGAICPEAALALTTPSTAITPSWR